MVFSYLGDFKNPSQQQLNNNQETNLVLGMHLE